MAKVKTWGIDRKKYYLIDSLGNYLELMILIKLVTTRVEKKYK